MDNKKQKKKKIEKLRAFWYHAKSICYGQSLRFEFVDSGFHIFIYRPYRRISFRIFYKYVEYDKDKITVGKLFSEYRMALIIFGFSRDKAGYISII